MCATWDGPNSESDSNEGQCRVSWLSDPLNNFRNFEASYGSDVNDSELRLSHNGRYLLYSGSGTYDMQMRRLNPGITLWDIESGAKVYDSHYEGGGGPIWGFGPDDSWFVVWMSHPVFGNGTYVLFVGDSIPRYRFPTYSTFFNDLFSQAFFIKKDDAIVASRKVTTDITPVSVAEDAEVLRHPYVKRGPALDNISVRLGTVECSVARDGGFEWQLYSSSMAVVANGRLMAQPDQSSPCEIIAKLNVVPASGLYILTYFSSTKKVIGSIKLMLE
ncbi:MAG: hypothetical protein IPF79_05105 [Ignavibacteria bacterium]|nr:hypothetical protein [Ignavibacteria bacterium]